MIYLQFLCTRREEHVAASQGEEKEKEEIHKREKSTERRDEKERGRAKEETER